MRQSSRSARDRAISLFIVLLLLMSAGSNFFVSVSQAAQAQDITSDLLAHWKMDDNLDNEVSGGNNLTFNGGSAAYETGKIDSGLSFDGSNDYANASVSDLPTGDAARTISLWVKADETSAAKFFSYGDTSYGGSFDFTVENVDGSNHILFRHAGGNVRFDGATLSSWMHVVIIVPDDATTTDDVQVYINNSAVTGERNGGSDRTLDTGSSDVYLGRRFSAGGQEHFDGAVDDVRIYDRALTAAEVEDLYELGQ